MPNSSSGTSLEWPKEVMDLSPHGNVCVWRGRGEGGGAHYFEKLYLIIDDIILQMLIPTLTS